MYVSFKKIFTAGERIETESIKKLLDSSFGDCLSFGSLEQDIAKSEVYPTTFDVSLDYNRSVYIVQGRYI